MMPRSGLPVLTLLGGTVSSTTPALAPIRSSRGSGWAASRVERASREPGAAGFLAGCAVHGSDQTGEGNPLVGTWEVLEYSDTPEGGLPVHLFGNPPVRVLGRRPRLDQHHAQSAPTPCRGRRSRPRRLPPAWYCSYFGTYTYDPAGPSWTTHVAGGNIPGYLGTDQERAFTVAGDTLIVAQT